MHVQNILGQTTRGQVIDALQALPTGLAENIGYTVERIQSQHPQSRTQATLAMNVLLWLSHAKRPLKVTELQHAVAIKPEEMRMEDLIDPDFFVHCCFGLTVIDKETLIIRLVHFSVNEYLQEHRSKFFPNAEDTLTSSCISYMFLHQSAVNRNEVPFLNYATRHWGIHARASVSLMTQQAVQKFCSSSVFFTWTKVLFIEVVKKDTTYELEAQYVDASSSVLHVAAIYGLEYLMEEYLIKNLAVNTIDSQNATPLMLASACGHTSILRRLLAQPQIDIHRVDREQHTALWYAVYRGQVQSVQILLSSGFDLDINKGKLFSLASQKVWGGSRYAEIMSLLLSQSELDPNCQDSEHDPPWFTLAIRWEFDLLRRLVSRPDFNPWQWTPPVKLWEGFSKFMAETDYDYFLGDELSNKKAADLPAIFRMLDIDERFCLPEFDMLYLMWPFVYYAFGKCIPYKDEGHTYSYEIDWMFIWDDTNWTWRSVLQQSLEANHLSFHTKDSKKRGFIHSLAQYGKEEYLKIILQEGVSVDDKDTLGRTALHYAAIEGHKGACDILLDAGASPHSADNKGETVLHSACSGGNLDVVNRLISLGADIHAKNKNESTALHFACLSGEGAPIVELILRKPGVDINCSNSIGSTPLHYAVSFNSTASMFTILDMKADCNICNLDGTALSEAIFQGYKAGIERLALDTDLNIPDCFGRSPRSQLPLFKGHRLGEMGQQYTELESPMVKRDVALSYLRKRLKTMLDADNDMRIDLLYRTAHILLELGDEVSAQVIFEQQISPFSNIHTVYWPDQGCDGCDGQYGYLYKCRTCAYVMLCDDCRMFGKENKDELLKCVGHSFLQLPSDEWGSLRKGTVNAEGETFNEFLKSLIRKYDEGAFQIIELENQEKPIEVADII